MKVSLPGGLKKAPRALLGALLVFFVWTGARGLDFGTHWDEDKLLSGLVQSFENHTFLPGSYLYPSLVHDLGWGAVAAVRFFGGERSPEKTIRSAPFLLGMRALTMFFSTAAIFLTYLAVLEWRRRPWEALAAATVLGLSWETAYHARWFTVDPPMTAFAAGVLFGCVGYWRHGVFRWLVGAALSAGLATGSKYTAGLLLLPVLLLSWRSPGNGMKRAAILTSVFAAVFLFTTPGVLLDPGSVLRDLSFQAKTYGILGNDAYTIGRGFPHAAAMAAYLGIVFSSPVFIVGAMAGGAAVVGGVDLFLKERNVALAFFLFPVVYLALFSLQVVMIARNLLVVTPFFAVLAARGIAVTSARYGRGVVGRVAGVLLLLAWVGGNGAFLWRASSSIKDRHRDDAGRAIREYILKRPNRRFLVTREAASAWGGRSEALPPNVFADPALETDFTVFSTKEAGGRWVGRWPANRPGYVETWFGPREVNLNYYPTWLGDPRFVVMRTDRAMRLWGGPS